LIVSVLILKKTRFIVTQHQERNINNPFGESQKKLQKVLLSPKTTARDYVVNRKKATVGTEVSVQHAIDGRVK